MVVSQDLGTLFGPGLLHTDNHPLLEFAAPRQMYTNDPTIEKTLSSRRLLKHETTSITPKIMTAIIAVEASFSFSIYILINGYDNERPIKPIFASQNWIIPSFLL